MRYKNSSEKKPTNPKEDVMETERIEFAALAKACFWIAAYHVLAPIFWAAGRIQQNLEDIIDSINRDNP